MPLDTKFNAMIPRDNRDLLVEDLENQSNAIHNAIGDRQDDVHPEFAGTVKSEVAGVVWGLKVSYVAGTDTLDISPGVVFNRGRRGSIATIKSIPMASVSVDDFIVARIWFEDVDLKTNPVTHVNEPVYRLYHCDIEVKVIGDIDEDDVVIGKVVDIDGGVPILGDTALWEYVSGGNHIRFIPRNNVGEDIFGPVGNKYFVRFSVLSDTPISVQKLKDTSGLDFTYLNIQLQGDSSGVVISTLQQIIDAVNSTPGYFRAELVSGSGSFVPTLLPTLYASYSQFSGGVDYRNYYETVSGSRSLAVTERFNTSDPYTKHISQKGRGVPSDRNPHGMTLEDMGVAELSTEEHIKREHFSASTLPRSASSIFLRTEIVSAFELKINKSSGVDDVGLIQGRVLKVASDLILNTPSLAKQELYQFFLTQGGTIQHRIIAEYKEFPGYPEILSGIRTVLSTVDKDPYLAGDKMLELVVSGGGTVFTARLGDLGAPVGVSVEGECLLVDVSVEGEYLLVDPSDNTWIRVYRENEAMPDGDYRNTVTFTPFMEITELPISMVFWKGHQTEWGYSSSQLFKDLRSYGSFSVNNEKYLDLANTVPVDFRETSLGGFTAFEGSSRDLTVNPFKIKYRGTLYRKTTATVLTIPEDFEGYLCASFDGLQGMSLSVVSESSFELMPDRVILAKAVSDAVEITTVSETFFTGSYNLSDKFYEFNISKEEDFIYALRTVKALEGTPGIAAFVFNVRENLTINTNSIFSGTNSIYSPFILNGHNKRLSFTGSTQIRMDESVIKDCFIDTDAAVFYSIGVDSHCTFQDSFITGTVAFGEFLGRVEFFNCYVGKFKVGVRVDMVGGRLLDSIVTVSDAAQVNMSKVEFSASVPMLYCESYVPLIDGTDINALNVSLIHCRVFGNGSLINVDPGCPEGHINLSLIDSRIKFSSPVTCDLSGHWLDVSVLNGALGNCVFVGRSALLSGYSGFFAVEGTTLSGIIGFKYDTVPVAWNDPVLITFKGVTFLGQLDITDFTSFVVESNCVFINDDILLSPVRSVFVEVTGQFPHPSFMENTWGSGGVPVNAFITCRGSLLRESFFYFYTTDPDALWIDLNRFFEVLNHTDHTIHIQGDYTGDFTEELIILGVQGSGIVSLEIPYFEIGKLSIIETVPFVSSVVVKAQLQQGETHALLIDNAMVFLSGLPELSVAPGRVSPWDTGRILCMKNRAYCELVTVFVEGSPGSGGKATKHLIDVLGFSTLKINTGEFKADPAGVGMTDSVANSYIYTESGSQVIQEGTVTFDTNFVSETPDSIYSIDNLAENFNYQHQWGIHSSDDLGWVKRALNNIKSIEGKVVIRFAVAGPTYDIDIDMKNVSGAGELVIGEAWSSPNKTLEVSTARRAFFQDFQPKLVLGIVDITSSCDIAAISLVNVPNFQIVTLKISGSFSSGSSGDFKYGCIITNSKGVIDAYSIGETASNENDLENAFIGSGQSEVILNKVSSDYSGASIELLVGTLWGGGRYTIADAGYYGTANWLKFRAPLDSMASLPGIYIRRNVSVSAWEMVLHGDSSGDLRVN